MNVFRVAELWTNLMHELDMIALRPREAISVLP
jgi:hypothetical protein